jgi:succinyl-diaminopimelate desuccinylase
MDMRVLPRYSIPSILSEIDRIKGEVAAKHGVTIEYSLAQRNESPPTSADAPLVRALSRAIKDVYAVNPRPIGIGGGTVGAFLRSAGIDSVVWAKVNNTAHQPNEYVLLDNILGDAKVMSLLLME